MRLVSCAWGLALALLAAAGCSLLVDAEGLSGGTDTPDAADSPSTPPPAPPGPPPVVPPDAGDAAKEAEAGRVTDALVALYTFNETSGSIVHDVSGFASPLDLTIELDGGAAAFVSGSLVVTSPILLQSQFAATKIINACKASHEVTLEMWVTPANVTQDATRIIGISGVNADHDVALDQTNDEYYSLMRTASSHDDLHAPGTLRAQLQHVAVTRAKNGARTIYVDGVSAVTDVAIDTDPAVWNDAFGVTGANATTFDAAWLGRFHLVAIYSRALSAQEIAQNFAIGPR